MVPFCCCCNYAIVDHIAMRIFIFVVLSMITAPDNVTTPHISKINFLIVSLNVRELELMLKRPVKEKGRPPCVGVEAQLTTQSLEIY